MKSCLKYDRQWLKKNLPGLSEKITYSEVEVSFFFHFPREEYSWMSGLKHLSAVWTCCNQDITRPPHGYFISNFAPEKKNQGLRKYKNKVLFLVYFSDTVFLGIFNQFHIRSCGHPTDFFIFVKGWEKVGPLGILKGPGDRSRDSRHRGGGGGKYTFCFPIPPRCGQWEQKKH